MSGLKLTFFGSKGYTSLYCVVPMQFIMFPATINMDECQDVFWGNNCVFRIVWLRLLRRRVIVYVEVLVHRGWEHALWIQANVLNTTNNYLCDLGELFLGSLRLNFLTRKMDIIFLPTQGCYKNHTLWSSQHRNWRVVSMEYIGQVGFFFICTWSHGPTSAKIVHC